MYAMIFAVTSLCFPQPTAPNSPIAQHPQRTESVDALLLSDGSVLATTKAPQFDQHCKSLQQALTPYSKSHTWSTSSDGRKVLLTPIQEAGAPVSTLNVHFMSDCNKPASITTFPKSYGARFLTKNAIHLFTVPDPQTGSRQRVVLLGGPEPVTVVVPRSISWYSIGSGGQWAGWNGDSIVVGAIEQNVMREQRTIRIPRITSIDGFFDGQFIWTAKDHVAVVGSEHNKKHDGSESVHNVTVLINITTGETKTEDNIYPLLQLDERQALAIDGRGHYVLCHLNNGALDPTDRPTGLKDTDTVMAMSPSQRMWLVRRQKSPLDGSTAGDWGIRNVPSTASTNNALPTLLSTTPVGWIELSE